MVMLKLDDWSYFEGRSELEDGTVVMRFYGQVNRDDPDNILITEKEETEDSYRKNVDTIRADRRSFEDVVYAESEEIRAMLPSSTSQEANCTEISENCDEAEKGGNDEV
jgi:hypothetical protein